MTREEAADLLDNLIGMVEDNQENDYDEALKMAIEALNVPDTNVGDTISRQAAIDALLRNQEVYSNNFGNDPIDKYTVAIIDNDAQTIAQLPSAQRNGKWIYTKKRLVMGGYVDASECSICHKRIMPHLKPNYCPNCGAEMKGEEDEL